MNKRKTNRLQKRFNYRCLNARQSCIYCVNWGLGCANGHPNVYPNDKSDYIIFCEEKMGAFKYLAKRLKMEGFSLSGWAFFEQPIENVYIFYNKKKHKEITVMYNTETSEYEIASTDLFWKYSDEYNVYIHNLIEEALNAPWQHWNFVYNNLDKTHRKIRKRALEKLRDKSLNN